MALGLREQIEAAWKDGSGLSWYDGSFHNLSANTIAYGQLWELTLHYNNCGTVCDHKCESGARNLVRERLECIIRGMPDVHPDIDSEIWLIAFELHKSETVHALSSSTMPDTITPTWSKENRTLVCNCYELATHQYNEQKKSKALEADVKIIPYDPEDRWYEPRYL